MPGMLDETEAILRWIAGELGPDTYVNLMSQYRPEGLVVRSGDYPEIRRLPHRDEYLRAVELALELGLRLDPRSAREGSRLPAPR
jgi:putative pyruvate formate lyase activating enzyme